jgi:hypothetical protein
MIKHKSKQLWTTAATFYKTDEWYIDLSDLTICGSAKQEGYLTEINLLTNGDFRDFVQGRLSYFFSSEFNSDLNLLEDFICLSNPGRVPRRRNGCDYEYCLDSETDNFMTKWSNQTKIDQGLEFLPRVKLCSFHSSWFCKAKSFIDNFSENDAMGNFAASQPYPTDKSFSGPLQCGFAKG